MRGRVREGTAATEFVANREKVDFLLKYRIAKRGGAECHDLKGEIVVWFTYILDYNS